MKNEIEDKGVTVEYIEQIHSRIPYPLTMTFYKVSTLYPSDDYPQAFNVRDVKYYKNYGTAIHDKNSRDSTFQNKIEEIEIITE